MNVVVLVKKCFIRVKRARECRTDSGMLLYGRANMDMSLRKGHHGIHNDRIVGIFLTCSLSGMCQVSY